MLADAAVHGGHQLRDPGRPGQVLTGPARPQLLRAAAPSGAMAPDRTGPVRHLLAQVVLRRSGVPEPRPAAVHRHERALHHLLGHPGVPDHHRGLPHQRLVMRQVQPGDRTIGAPAAARRHPASPPGHPPGQGPGHAHRTHRVIHRAAPRRAIVGLPPGHLIKQVRFGPAMEGCCGQRRVLELRVFPAAEGAFGQEPLA